MQAPVGRAGAGGGSARKFQARQGTENAVMGMFFWRRRPHHPGPIMLLEPAEGSLTPPLQQFRLPGPDAEADLPPDPDGLPQPRPESWWNPQRLSTDRSQPQPVAFRWLPPPARRRGLTYDLLIATDQALAHPLVLQGIEQPQARIRHLFVDTDYYWKVIANHSGVPVSESPVRHFRTHPALPRWLRVPEMTNVRDLGGWPVPGGQRVRQGLIYRSSEMNSHLNLTPEGTEILLHELGIRTDLDLRAESEEPAPALPSQWVRHVSLPIRPYDGILEPEVQSTIAALFVEFAQAEAYPILMHCWAGADRAATAAFLLHAALGVQEPELAADYELSSLSVWGDRSRHSPQYNALLAALATFAESPTDTVNVHAVNYLRACGVPPEALEAIRALLLETAPAPLPEREIW